MALKGETVKSKEERREIVLKALKIQAGLSDKTMQDVANEHGITRQGVYEYLPFVTDDPEERLRQAEEEVEFRREVFKLVRGRANRSRAADRSIRPAVATPGLADEPPHHDDHVGEGDPEIFDPIHPLGKPH